MDMRKCVSVIDSFFKTTKEIDLDHPFRTAITNQMKMMEKPSF